MNIRHTWLAEWISQTVSVDLPDGARRDKSNEPSAVGLGRGMEDLTKMVPLAQSGILSPDSFLKGCEWLVKRHAAGAAEGVAPAKTPRVEGQATSNLPARQPSKTANAAVARRRLLDASPQATLDPSSTRPVFDSFLFTGDSTDANACHVDTSKVALDVDCLDEEEADPENPGRFRSNQDGENFVRESCRGENS